MRGVREWATQVRDTTGADIDVIVEYRISGRYLPATRDEPAEGPTAEIMRIRYRYDWAGEGDVVLTWVEEERARDELNERVQAGEA